MTCVSHACSRYISKTILQRCIFTLAKQFRGKKCFCKLYSKTVFLSWTSVLLFVRFRAERDQSRVTNWLVLFDVFLWHLAAACPLFSAYQCCSDRCICVTCLAELSADKWKKKTAIKKLNKWMTHIKVATLPLFLVECSFEVIIH